MKKFLLSILFCFGIFSVSFAGVATQSSTTQIQKSKEVSVATVSEFVRSDLGVWELHDNHDYKITDYLKARYLSPEDFIYFYSLMKDKYEIEILAYETKGFKFDVRDGYITTIEDVKNYLKENNKKSVEVHIGYVHDTKIDIKPSSEMPAIMLNIKYPDEYKRAKLNAIGEIAKDIKPYLVAEYLNVNDAWDYFNMVRGLALSGKLGNELQLGNIKSKDELEKYMDLHLHNSIKVSRKEQVLSFETANRDPREVKK